MRSKCCTRYLASLAILAAFAGCKRSAETSMETPTSTSDASPVQVYVVNYALKYFAARIAGDTAEIVFPTPAEADSATWRPDAKIIASFQQADLILMNGAGYARWARHATLPASKIVNTSIGFGDQYIGMENTARHVHGPKGDHEHGGTAATTWLDPLLAIQQAESILNGLVTLLPNDQSTLNENFGSLTDDLQTLNNRLESITRDHHSTPLLASHPVYQYLARRYQLNLRSVHWEPDQSPGESQWIELDHRLSEHPARWMLWEAPPQRSTELGLNERGVQCIVFYPCGNVPPAGDYLQTMQENIARLRGALSTP